MPLEWDSTSLGIPQYVTDLNKRGEKLHSYLLANVKGNFGRSLYIYIYISQLISLECGVNGQVECGNRKETFSLYLYVGFGS